MSPKQGSSPLTRGKHETVCRTLERVGLIPAHAGKTWTGSDPIFSPSAHPRSRRENAPHSIHADAVDWLIPAHAGKTADQPVVVFNRGTHPRSRGENESIYTLLPVKRGSSPLTRGKPRPVVLARVRAGLIPAHAGKTHAHALHERRREAHPRSRGENDATPLAADPINGSSPLTRGKPHDGKIRALSRGLIPAHAGKTILTEPHQGREQAHPR